MYSNSVGQPAVKCIFSIEQGAKVKYFVHGNFTLNAEKTI